MKSFNYIEETSFEELERLAEDKSVEVPAGIRENLENTVLAAAAIEELKPENGWWHRKSPLYAFAAVAACAILLVSLPGARSPKDTYSSPEMAYAELEKTLNLIAEKMDNGMELSQQIQEEPINTINRIFEKLNN